MTDKVSREELLHQLNDFIENNDINGDYNHDPEVFHSTAESLLLNYIDDKEIENAWSKAADHWWYA